MKPASYATLLSMVAALGGLLFGYDTAVVAGAIGFLRNHFTLNAAETGFAASSALLGCILGAAVAGSLSDKFGRKRALILSAVFFTISAIWSAIPTTLTEFNIARIIGGVGVGMASMLSPLYIAEIAPAGIRGRLISFNQFAIVTGILLVYFVNYWIAGLGDESWNTAMGWRWMFGSETIPALLFMLSLIAIPESPRWLIKQGNDGAAFATLTKLSDPVAAARDVRDIKDAIALEGSSLGDLLRPGMRRALVIGLALAILQQVTGINVFLYYAPEIFKSLGSGTDIALLQTVIIGAFNVVFTLIAIRNVDRLGRKPLLMIGSGGMAIALIGLGWAAYTGTTAVWTLVFILGYVACFALSMGPVVWVVLAEIFPTRLRGRAMAIATLLLWTSNYIVSSTFPMLDANPWLLALFHHAFPFWLFAFFCLITIIVVWRFLPETKGRTLEEIERSWDR
jgi:SP family xylose:H+ symportor-like MFS transporter